MKNTKIEPKIILTILNSNINNLPIIIRDNTANILNITHENKLGLSNHEICKNVMSLISMLVIEYNVDTILMEQNQLFIDKIDRYPDPHILHNVLLGYAIKILIEDKYWENYNLIEIPKWEWKKEVLNNKVDYAVDLYKNHIIQQNLTNELIDLYDKNNYYETLCFSESLYYDKFLNKKYQINR